MVDLSTTIYMIGNSLGAVLITPFSDRYGRKWVLLISLWIQGLIGIALAFVNSYPLFVCLRFCIGCLNMVSVKFIFFFDAQKNLWLHYHHSEILYFTHF